MGSHVPVFDAGTGLHHLQFSSDSGNAASRQIVEINQRRFTNQLYIGKGK